MAKTITYSRRPLSAAVQKQLADLNDGPELDKQFFAQHSARSYRARPATAGEVARLQLVGAQLAAGMSWFTIVHQVCSWASHAVMNGAPLMVVAKNLGHADTRMVEKHYGHLAPSFIADAIRAGAPRYGIKADKQVVSLR
jgi:site-specific recombinase XerD